MKHVLLALTLALTAATPALAHPDHDEYETTSPRVLAESSASHVVQTMIDRQIIGPSWRGALPTSTNLRQRNGATEWVVTFRNNAVQDPAKRLLYVMVTQTGTYIAANYTGN